MSTQDALRAYIEGGRRTLGGAYIPVVQLERWLEEIEKLSKLKPPEPKFKVGQVVMQLEEQGEMEDYECPGKIESLEFKKMGSAAQAVWWYSLNNSSIKVAESDLRALTAEERGE